MSTRVRWGRWLAVLALVLIAAGVAAATVFIIGGQLSGPVYDCVESGGCWDVTRQACEFEDQCRCTPERCVAGPDGGLVLPPEPR